MDDTDYFSYQDFLLERLQVRTLNGFRFCITSKIYLLSQLTIQYIFPFTIFVGNNAAFRNYITTATFSSERTKYISIAAGFQCLGMTIGPALQASLSPLQCSKPSMDSYISFDMFTAAG